MSFDRSRWPGYYDTPRQRELAWLDGQTIRSLNGDVFHVQQWEEIKRAAFAGHYDVYTSDLLGSWWFESAVNDSSVRLLVPGAVLLHGLSPVTSLVITEGEQRVWIVSSRAWGHPAANYDFLVALHQLFVLCAVGVRPTPGSLGQALMRQTWQAAGLAPVTRPPNQCREDLLNHCLGGRVDYFVSQSDHFDVVYEADLAGAYASLCDRLPDGPTVCLSGEPEALSDYATAFLDCRITIPARLRLDLGVFGIKTQAGNSYPIAAGSYDAWLWREEVDACRRAGMTVKIRSGWAWTTWNDGLSSWAQSIYTLRQMATLSNSLLAGWLKQATVSALGRFGMPLWQWQILPETSLSVCPGDIGLLDNGQQTGYVLHQVHEPNANHLTHWYSYILMRARLALRARMQWEHDRNNTILASNYDAVYTVLPADPDSLGLELGAWKQTELHSVRFPYPRGVISAEKVTLPGTKR